MKIPRMAAVTLLGTDQTWPISQVQAHVLKPNLQLACVSLEMKPFQYASVSISDPLSPLFFRA